jgi:putative two-component system response regulator
MGPKRSKIIVVDDDLTNLTIARNALADTHDAFTVPSGKKLFELLEKLRPDLILLDIEMPGMGGYEVIEVLKKEQKTAGIPVIFLTSIIDPESEVKGLSLGAVDYITKPFSRELLLKRIELHLLIVEQRNELKNYSQNLEKMVDKKTQTVFELQNAILRTVAELVESRDNITGGHIERTQNYLSMFVGFLLEHGVYTEQLLAWDINLFVMSSQLHDVGKVSIKDRILMNPGKLNDEEFTEMKKHTTYGVDIIKRIEVGTPESAFLKHAEILAGTHHEKWDGTGYPLGLKGEEIPLEGRLMSIIDVYDALTNDRPYKKAFSHEESIAIIKSGLGTYFDPVLCEVFLLHEQDFQKRQDGGDTTYRLDQENMMWKSVSQTVAAIIDARTGIESKDMDRMRVYLRILINALLEHDRFREEVLSWDIDIFLLSAQLHDIGKLAVDDNILHKREKLTEAEYDDVKAHANFGARVARHIQRGVNENVLFHHAEKLTGSHHERWDGSGYPLGLKGGEIPLQGRLMAIVDVFDALTNDRPNREKMSPQDAIEIVKLNSGTYFDPDIVDIFLEHKAEFVDAASQL